MAPNQAAPGLVLPLSVVSSTDVGRLLRELEATNDTVLQQELKGIAPILPQPSLLMTDLLAANSINLLDKTQRQQLTATLLAVKKQAPILHISFGAEPAEDFIDKLMGWLRQEIHPFVLVTIGLQPNIGAGCLVRSANKFFDFSLRKNFTQNRDLLMSKLREVITA